MDRLGLAPVVPQATATAPFVELAELTHVMKSAGSDDQLGLIPQGWLVHHIDLQYASCLFHRSLCLSWIPHTPTTLRWR